MLTRFFLIILVLVNSTALASAFEEPPCLKKNINFWYDVYTKYDSSDGIILDAESQELKIIRKISLPSSEEKRKNAIKRVKRLYKKNSQSVRIITGIRSKFMDGLENDIKYRSMVERKIKIMNLPIEVSALPHVESGYNPKARSKVGAVGLWQVMPATAKMYGFDPKRLANPSYNTEVGLHVLYDAYAVLGSWPLAITAYNHGVNGVNRAIKETGSTDICTIMKTYSGPRFGVSSRNFYASFLAVLRILRDEGLLDE